MLLLLDASDILLCEKRAVLLSAIIQLRNLVSQIRKYIIEG